MRIILLILTFFLIPPAHAQKAVQIEIPKDSMFRETEFPLPRFVSLSSPRVYVRMGPGQKYPIQWVFARKKLPIEVILEFENWRKVKDYQGQVGWLHKSLLSGKRTALVSGEDQASLYSKPNKASKLAAYLEPSVLVDIKECDGAWCRVNASGYKGWVQQTNLWGVYPDEVIED